MGITITPLNSGFCTSNPKTYHYHPSTHKYYTGVSDEDRQLPVFCYLLNTGDELILVDTGMADTDRANRYHHPGSLQLPDQAMPSPGLWRRRDTERRILPGSFSPICTGTTLFI
ncbi:MAG: hypothetical protein LUH04_08885 [Clostridium sp.]|nr:hypothetical protein [Clostridium sp.]